MTATIVHTPWTSRALDLDDEHEIALRAVGLHVRVRLGGKSPKGPWSVRIHSWAGTDALPRQRVEHFRKRGDLAALIHRALDEFETRYVYTADELLAIQRASAA